MIASGLKLQTNTMDMYPQDATEAVREDWMCKNQYSTERHLATTAAGQAPKQKDIRYGGADKPTAQTLGSDCQ